MYEINIPNYYNRFDTESQFSDYKQLLFRAGDILQGAEVNEVQTIAKNDFSLLRTKFIKNGQFINGGEVSISKVGTGVFDANNYELFNFEILCKGGVIFFDGNFIEIDEASFQYQDTIIPDMDEKLGVELTYEIVTFREDSTLVEPANNIRNFGQPGADRLSIKGVWVNGDSQAEYYVNVAIVDDGIVLGEKKQNPFDKAVIEIIAEYDRESRGNYLVSGYKTNFLEKDTYLGNFTFQISEGKADVMGYKVSRDYTSEFKLPELVDYELHQGEPAVFNGNGVYDLSHDPVRKVFRISGEKNITRNLDHGSYSGVSDSLPSEFTPVVRIKTVYQGATVYQEGRDYFQDGDSINWQTQDAGAIEPAPNTQYTIEWDYRETQTYSNFLGNNGDINADRTGVTLEGYVPNSVVSIDYDFILQRKDIIAIDANGDFQTIKGTPRELDPITPRYNEDNLLSIAEVLLSGNNDPEVVQSGQRVFMFEDIENLYDDIRVNEYNIGRMALKLNLKGIGNGLKNAFVDTFQDDAWRDAGIESATNYVKAMTSSGDLSLNINWETHPTYIVEPGYELIPSNSNTVRLRTNGTPTLMLQQPHYTGVRKITELFFAAAPKARLRVTPSYYSWVDRNIFLQFVEDRQARTATRSIWGWNWWWWRSSWARRWWWNWGWGSVRTVRQNLSTSRSTVTSVRNSERPAIIPQIELKLVSDEGDFNNSESIDIKWGGRVIQNVSASATGKLDLTFNVPANEMSGSKNIEAVGTVSGVEGSTVFFAQPLTRTVSTTTTRTWRWLRTVRWWWWWRRDPVAQSFNVGDNPIVLDSIKVWFEVAPTSDTFVEVVEMTAGMPDTSKILTSMNYRSGDIADNSSFTFDFTDKVTLEANTSYSFIIGCEDPSATIQIAKLGERSINTGKWITSQAYDAGVFFNSSNNETWSPIQDEDMRFEIYTDTFENSRTFLFDPVSVTDATDLMFLNQSEISQGNEIKYDIILLDNGPSEMNDVMPFTHYATGFEYTGDVQVRATLTSNGASSPEVNLDGQILAGKVDTSSTYTSAGFKFDPNDAKIGIYIDSYSEDSADYSIEVQILQGGSWNWINVPLISSEQLEDQWFEDYFELDIQAQNPDIGQKISRVRINLSTGDVADRIILQSLRLNTINL